MANEIIIFKNDREEIKKLKELIIEKNLSIPMVSYLSKIPATTIYRWFKSQRYLKWKILSVIKKIEKVKGII